MKKLQRLLASFLVVLLIALIPSSVYAMGYKGYIPTAGEHYYLDSEAGVWKLSSTFKYTYDSKGRIKKYESRDTDGDMYTQTYKWKGDYVVKTTTSTSYGYSSTVSRTFKKNKIQKVKVASVSEGRQRTSVSTYKWKGKKAAVTSKDSDGKVTSMTVKVNGKNKFVSMKGADWSETYSYYGNGNLKSYTYNYSGKNSSSYNKKGFRTKGTGTVSYYSDDVLTKTDTYTTKDSFTMNKKKKCPQQIIETETYPDGRIHQSKTVFTSYKKVSGARNCDASGYGVPFG